MWRGGGGEGKGRGGEGRGGEGVEKSDSDSICNASSFQIS